MISTLQEMLSYLFIQRALIVGILVSLCSAVLGVSLVLKKYSMIGDGLSHVGFGALSVAFSLNSLPLIANSFKIDPLIFSIIMVLIIAFLLLRISENSKIASDSAIALISATSLTIGVLAISLTTGINTDVCNTLFGTILAMTKSDVHLSIVLSIIVLILFVVFYHKIFAVTFDENFAKATGIRTNIYNMIIAFLTAIIIVLGMRLMGTLLISSLIIFPALTSMRLCKTFKAVIISSAIISVICFFFGVVLSYTHRTPAGASIVLMNIIVFIVFTAVSFFKERIWTK